MKLYFSGVASSSELAMLQSAGVQRILVNSLDYQSVIANSNWDGSLALDNPAYKLWKQGEGESVDVPAYLHTTTARNFDFAIAPDIIGSPAQSHQNYLAATHYRKILPHPYPTPIVPVYEWGTCTSYLWEYLETSEIVAIGKLVPAMRAKHKPTLEALELLCNKYPQRFHILGINWLEAIERLNTTAYSGDTSKWLDGARYGHVFFIHKTTGRLRFAPAKKIPEYQALNREQRCIKCAKTLNLFCENS